MDYDLAPVDIDPFGGVPGMDAQSASQMGPAAWNWLMAAPQRFTQAQAQDHAAQEAWRQQSGSTDPLGLLGADGSLSPRVNQGIAIMGGLAGNGISELASPVDSVLASRLAGVGDRAAREALPVDSAPALPAVDSVPAQAAAPNVNLEPIDHDPFIVYHGSRHTFDEAPDNPFGVFQDSAIGSGEGAQVYGVGHYVAQNPKIAEFYRTAGATDHNSDSILFDGNLIHRDEAGDMLGNDEDDKVGRGLLAFHKANGDVSHAVTTLRDAKGEPKPPGASDVEYEKTWRKAAGLPVASDDEILQNLQELHEGYLQDFKNDQTAADWLEQNGHRMAMPEPPDPGNLYKVQFNANPDHLLDWDAPFSEQHPEVQAKLQAAGLHPQSDFYLDGMTPEEEALSVKAGFKMRPPLDPNPPDLTGEDLYSQIGTIQGQKAAVRLDPTRNDVLASKALSEAGIPGIKYYDAGSRSNNVFNQSLVRQYKQTITDYEGDIQDLQNKIANPPPDTPDWLHENRKISIDSIQNHINMLKGKIDELSQDDRTRNLVVFNPKHLNIVSRNGESLDLAPVDHDPFNPEDPFYTGAGAAREPTIPQDEVRNHPLWLEDGQPGYSIETPYEGSLNRVAAYRDDTGAVKGSVNFYLKHEIGGDAIPGVLEDRPGYPDQLTTYVSPDSRRQGVASGLYDYLHNSGYNIRQRIGKGDLTPDGAAFTNALQKKLGVRP